MRKTKEYLKKGIDVCLNLTDLVKVKIKQVMRQFHQIETKRVIDWENISIQETVNHLVESHEAFKNHLLPQIEEMMKICFLKFEEKSDQYFPLLYAFKRFQKQMVEHFEEEEKGFFSYAKNVERNVKNLPEAKELVRQAGALEFEENHHVIWDDFEKIYDVATEIAEKGEMPESILLNRLSSFREALMQHDAIENNWLYKKVRNLELMIGSM